MVYILNNSEADDEEREYAAKYDWDQGLGCKDLVHSPLSIGLRLMTELSGTAVPSIAQRRREPQTPTAQI
jgi:hypothetical protein